MGAMSFESRCRSCGYKSSGVVDIQSDVEEEIFEKTCQFCHSPLMTVRIGKRTIYHPREPKTAAS